VCEKVIVNEMDGKYVVGRQNFVGRQLVEKVLSTQHFVDTTLRRQSISSTGHFVDRIFRRQHISSTYDLRVRVQWT
jgi:hypothetical protein